MANFLRIIWRLVYSIEGLLLLLCMGISFTLWCYDYKDVSLITSILGLFIAIAVIIRDKISQSSVVEKRVEEYIIYLDKMCHHSLFGFFEYTEDIISSWKKGRIAHAEEKISHSLSIPLELLIDDTLSHWLNMSGLDVVRKDFIKYVYYKIIFPSEDNLNKICKKYVNNLDEPNTILFLNLIYGFFLAHNDDLNSLLKNPSYSEEDRRKSLFFIKDSLQELTTILSRIDKLSAYEQKSKYLDNLNQEIRKYLQEKGASIDKYGEVFLSGLGRVFVIFQQKLGTSLKKSLDDNGIPYLPLHFTGPYLILCEDINSAYELKKKLNLNLKSTDPHNLLITRLMPSDTHISVGMNPQLKKTSKKQLDRIKDVLLQLGKISTDMKKNVLILDKPLQEFVETLYYDFLIVSPISPSIKTKLRAGTSKIRTDLSNKYSNNFNKLTDIYNVSKQDMDSSLKTIIGENTIVSQLSDELLKGAKTWRFILYGYN